jgi:DNA-binding response OmpR family regulator
MEEHMESFPADGRTPHILIVDDDRGMANLIESMLKSRGYQVSIAYSGSQAIQMLEELAEQFSPWQSFPIDVVLLDVMMPGVDGFKICQSIKTDPMLRHVPVIMLTALDGAADKVTAVEFGADGYITKPFLPEELNAAIKARLQVKYREEELVRKNAELAALNAVSAAAVRTLDPDRVLNESFAALMAHTNLSAAALYRYDESAALLQRVIHQGIDRPETLLVEDGLAGQVFHAQHIVHKANLDDDPDFPPESLGGSSAFIGVPLRVGEQSLGILEVYHRQPYGFAEQDLKLYEEIGHRIGIALQNAEIFCRAQTLLLKSSALGA